MFELKKGKCKLCSEDRLLSEDDICILCSTNYVGPGVEIKQTANANTQGTVIKSKTGSPRENLEFSKINTKKF